MPKNDLDSNEKHWPHKRLFRARHTSSRFRRDAIALVLSALACLFATGRVLAGTAAPRLSVDNETATAGFYQLNWDAGAGTVELQEAFDPEFRTASTLYRGADMATVVSGKPDGTWHYRVRVATAQQQSPWSEPVTVTVAHHELSRALMVLSLGFGVFVAVVLTVIRGKAA